MQLIKNKLINLSPISINKDLNIGAGFAVRLDFDFLNILNNL